MINVTDQSFETEVLQSDLPVLVDFWAEWCGPCRMIGPIVEEIANEYQGKLKVVKVDIQNNQQIAMKYQIRSIPALFIFKKGQIHAQELGAMSKTQLKAFIDKSL